MVSPKSCSIQATDLASLYQGSQHHISPFVICNRRCTEIRRICLGNYLGPTNSCTLKMYQKKLLWENDTSYVFVIIKHKAYSETCARKKSIKGSLSIPTTSTSRSISCPSSWTHGLCCPITTACTAISPVKAYCKRKLNNHITNDHQNTCLPQSGWQHQLDVH